LQDLTGRYGTPLCPSSMSAGNTQKNERTPEIEHTARGSVSIVPPSPTADQVVEIPSNSDEHIPLPFAGIKGNPGRAQRPGPDGTTVAWRVNWPGGEGWVQTP